MDRAALILAVAYYALVSAVAAGAFAWDKHAAVAGRRRVPERRLHALSLIGGWPGAFAAMRVFRHKRRKPRFVALTWLAAAAHAVAWAGILWLLVSRRGP